MLKVIEMIRLVSLDICVAPTRIRVPIYHFCTEELLIQQGNGDN